MSKIGIKVANVSKNFHLPHEKANTLKGVFTGLIKTRLFRHAAYETQHALKDISFEIKKGEFFGIVGRNGSGKSTLLKILAGIYQPTKGDVSVTGRLVPFIELGVGFNPELTGRENIYLNGALLNFSESEVSDMYDEIVDFAELHDFMDQKLKNYSSGMQVRLAFSMAIKAEADILLVDEVLAVGDADFQRKCFDYFNYLKKSKTTVVFVSHDMEAVRQYCDKAILIEDNKLVKAGRAEEISQAYLRQFNESQDTGLSFGDDDTVSRWGDGAITIEGVSAITTKNSVIIKQELVANKNVDGFIAGIRIKNSAGQHITGTNTKLEHKEVSNFKAGETLQLVWTLPNIFSDGSYILDPAVLHLDEITVSDWWDDAAQFMVKKDRKLPYITDPGFKVEIRK